MDLTVLGSSSKGNSYILDSGSNKLLLECGVKFSNVQKDCDFVITSISGCLLTHSHFDHSKYAKDIAKAGIDIYSSQGTFDKLFLFGHRYIPVSNKQTFIVGEFTVKAFDVIHDCVDPLGFLIYHEDMGNCLFVTDSNYIPFNFPNLNQILVEVNYDDEILDERMYQGKVHESVRNRVSNSHMELKTFKHFLSTTDISKVNNIVMLHLSDSNSNEKQFIKEIQELTGKSVYAARAGMKINLSKTPF